MGSEVPAVFNRSDACRTCKDILEDDDRRHCDACLPEVKARIGEEIRTPVLAALERLRAEGRDPGHGRQAAVKRAATLTTQQNMNRAWEAEQHPELDGVDFTRDIWPKIRDMPVRQLAHATGLSVVYCSRIRSGEQVPHPRHWDRLATLDTRHSIMLDTTGSTARRLLADSRDSA